jgi:hypothetical protein
MNLTLLQPVKKIKPGSKTMFIYAPSVVTGNEKMEPGTILRVLDVFEGTSTSDTTLKVMTADDFAEHSRRTMWNDDSTACQRYIREEADPKCECEKELSEMSDDFRSKVHYILLADVRK